MKDYRCYNKKLKLRIEQTYCILTLSGQYNDMLIKDSHAGPLFLFSQYNEISGV